MILVNFDILRFFPAHKHRKKGVIFHAKEENKKSRQLIWS